MKASLLACLVLGLVALAAAGLSGNETTGLFDYNAHSIGVNRVMPLKEVEHEYCVMQGMCPQLGHVRVQNDPTRCVNGLSTVLRPDGTVDDKYPCNNVDLQAYVPVENLVPTELSPRDLNDIWGAEVVYTDASGNEVTKYLALVGLMNGLSVVDVTNSENPNVIGFLETRRVRSIWRDVKVFKDYAFIVAETPGHGMQVLDLLAVAQLPESDDVVLLEEAAYFDGFGNAHNIVINEETGFAYAVGTGKCSGGLFIVDVNDPLNPTEAGCFFEDGYTHDAQCVVYRGPDSRYSEHEICFNYNEDTLTIVDVSDKKNIVMISRTEYHGSAYTHQGWLTEDHTHVLMDDELDEMEGTTYDTEGVGHGSFTRTMIWNVEDLTAPFWSTTFIHSHTSIDHNLYIKNNRAYCSNYCSGLRVLDVSDLNDVHEIANFDIAPYCDGPLFQGTWSNYPYFEHPDDSANSQIVIVSSIERGLFVLKVNF